MTANKQHKHVISLHFLSTGTPVLVQLSGMDTQGLKNQGQLLPPPTNSQPPGASWSLHQAATGPIAGR